MATSVFRKIASGRLVPPRGVLVESKTVSKVMMKRRRNKLRHPSSIDGGNSAIGKFLRGQLIAVVIATPVSASSGAASDTCV